MSPVLALLEPAAAGAALVIGLLAGFGAARARRWKPAVGAGRVRRILLPFTGTTISRRSLDAALRLAGAEDATLVPAYLAIVPMNLPLDVPVARECETALPLLEAIEQRASAARIRVDSRVERGRSYRDALRRILVDEPFDRVIVSATASEHEGFSSEDIAWLLKRAPAEVLILRPAPDDQRTIAAVAATNGSRGSPAAGTA
ncbi:MAG TPA: universal stress protein [Solirubrobacteraceae bacterium]|nr:universal stress protein [Solirubrobacteraceae bacterium]